MTKNFFYYFFLHRRIQILHLFLLSIFWFRKKKKIFFRFIWTFEIFSFGYEKLFNEKLFDIWVSRLKIICKNSYNKSKKKSKESETSIFKEILKWEYALRRIKIRDENDLDGAFVIRGTKNNDLETL